MKSLYTIICFTLLVACSGNSNNDEYCNYLLDINVNHQEDMSLSPLNSLFSGGSVYIPNIGNAGVIVVQIGEQYLAWDAADPNYIPGTCAHLEPSGLIATSNCGDGNTYSLTDGEAIENIDLRCALKFYAVQRNGNILTIYN